MKTFTFVCLVLVFFSAACAHRQLPTPTDGPPPTEIVYPPTWTPEPTQGPSPLPPTQTPNPGAAAVVKAVKNTDGLNVYSTEVTLTVTSKTVSLYGESPGSPLTLLHMRGSLVNNDGKLEMNGAVISTLTGDTHRPLELVQIGGRDYIQGPLPGLGADQNKWYYADASANSQLAISLNTRLRLDILSSAKSPPPPFNQVGTEKLYGRSCTRYHVEGSDAGKFIAASAAQQELLLGTLNRYPLDVTRGQIDVWACDDGYIHRVDYQMRVLCGCKRNDSIDIGVSLHLWDINIIIPVQAPAGAIPLNKDFSYPTPVPDVPVQTS